MHQSNYTCCINADITATAAFDGINRVSEWWTQNLNGDAKSVNGLFTVKFGETFVKCFTVKQYLLLNT